MFQCTKCGASMTEKDTAEEVCGECGSAMDAEEVDEEEDESDGGAGDPASLGDD